jgi:hypothetical protein
MPVIIGVNLSTISFHALRGMTLRTLRVQRAQSAQDGFPRRACGTIGVNLSTISFHALRGMTLRTLRVQRAQSSYEIRWTRVKRIFAN